MQPSKKKWLKLSTKIFRCQILKMAKKRWRRWSEIMKMVDLTRAFLSPKRRQMDLVLMVLIRTFKCPKQKHPKLQVASIRTFKCPRQKFPTPLTLTSKCRKVVSMVIFQRNKLFKRQLYKNLSRKRKVAWKYLLAVLMASWPKNW